MTPDGPMSAAWRRYGQWLATVVAIGFAITIALSALDMLNVTAPTVQLPNSTPLPDRLAAILENQSQRFPLNFVAAVVAAVAFAAFAALGAVLARLLERDDPRGSLVSASFGLAGIVGVIGQLAFIGMQAVASDPTYCQCEFADPQLIARGQLLDVTGSVQSWSIWGALILMAVGLLALGTIGADRLRVPAGWARLSTWLGVLVAVVAVVGAAFPPLAQSLRWDVDSGLVTGIPSLVVLLVLVPWWALWLRRILTPEVLSD